MTTTDPGEKAEKETMTKKIDWSERVTREGFYQAFRDASDLSPRLQACYVDELYDEFFGPRPEETGEGA
jgi:hypothetical protein